MYNKISRDKYLLFLNWNSPDRRNKMLLKYTYLNAKREITIDTMIINLFHNTCT